MSKITEIEVKVEEGLNCSFIDHTKILVFKNSSIRLNVLSLAPVLQHSCKMPALGEVYWLLKSVFAILQIIDQILESSMIFKSIVFAY